MKKVRGAAITKPDLTDNLEEAHGEENIAEKFCTVYEELYNSSGSGDALEALKYLVNNMITDDHDTLNEVIKVSGQVVKEAACKLKLGKNDVSEGYTSDAILNAPDILFDMLSNVYRPWLIHGSVHFYLF